VNLELSDQQASLRDRVRAFVDAEIRPVAHEWERSGRYPTEIVDGMKAMGLFGITVPKRYGGLEIDMVSLTLVFEEISRGWMGIAGIIGSHSLSCWMIARYGTEEQRKRWLPAFASGERRTGIALTEPRAGSDLQGIGTTARREGDEYVVNGAKTWIGNARHADPLPVLVKTDPDAEPRHHGMSVLMVPAGTPGYQVVRDLDKLGYNGLESCELAFHEARVPADHLLGGEEGHGLRHALSALEVGRLNVASRGVGIAQEALDLALAYAKRRQAFGGPIGDFEGVQIKLADMATKVRAARLVTWWAAAAVDAGRRSDAETAMAKLLASETALECALTSMRVHGGIGYSTELDVERLYRDAPLLAIGEGTNDVLRIVIARDLLRRA
jgi:alkylation response protein AidB-like acyl-CoA dehydrogenase